MNFDRKAQDIATSAQPDQMTRREWTKPEAKIADVAKATLAGGHNFSASDLGSCNS